MKEDTLHTIKRLASDGLFWRREYATLETWHARVQGELIEARTELADLRGIRLKLEAELMHSEKDRRRLLEQIDRMTPQGGVDLVVVEAQRPD